MLDKKGREIKEGDILKCFHFVGARNKKHYMYKIATRKGDRLVAMDIEELLEKGKGDAHTCPLEALCADTEIIQEKFI